MDNNLIEKLKQENALLKEKLEKKEIEITEILRYSDMALVETKDDMRILNTYGEIENIFTGGIKHVERGNNLLKVIYKTTNNTKISESELVQHNDAGTYVEDAVRKFVEGTIEEKLFRIVGEKPDGEIFLLNWRIRRMERSFLSYFKIVPTNSIIEASQDKFKREMEFTKFLMRSTLNLFSDGAIILDLQNKITYMNGTAKMFFVVNSNKLLQNAQFEGRFFQELLVIDSADEIKKKLDTIKQVIVSKQPQSIVRKVNDRDVMFKIYPFFDENGFVAGTITIIKENFDLLSDDRNKAYEEQKKLMSALQQISKKAKELTQKNNEMEANQKWLMKSNQDYLSNLRSIYSIIDSMPIAVCVLSYPSQKIDYVNKCYEIKFTKSKDDIKGRTDEEYMSMEDAIVFKSKNFETAETNDTVNVSTPNFFAKQVALINQAGKTTQIVRVIM